MKSTTNDLRRLAAQIRIWALRGIYSAQSGHPGGSLSCADILACLYGRVMRHDPENPGWRQRDRFILSKGHAAPAYYATLGLRGYFPVEEMEHLRQLHSFLQGHPCMSKVPGVDFSSGSLGQGLSAANGMALAARLDALDYKVYCLVGDGELQEGQCWEAIMTAAHYHLDNLTLLVDNNGLQIDGPVAQVMGNEPLDRRLQAFGWHVLPADGHDTEAVLHALQTAAEYKGGPSAVVFRTVKGRGVSYMENLAEWHGRAPTVEQYEQAMAELKNQLQEATE